MATVCTRLGILFLAAICPLAAHAAPKAVAVEAQPFLAHVERLAAALEYVGSPLSPALAGQLAALQAEAPTADTVRRIQELLDPLCLALVNINPEARVKVEPGGGAATLQEAGWRSFLIKVHNEGAVRAALECESPNAAPALHASSGRPEPKPENLISPEELATRFLEIAFYTGRPLTPELSGLPVEYKILQIYTNARGKREASLQFHIGEGTRDLGHRSSLPVLFDAQASTKVLFEVIDDDGSPAMASFTIRDNVERLADIADGWKRPEDYRNARALNEHWARPGIDAHPPLTGVYPLPSRRVALADPYPDFFFQPQIYRQTGEYVMLPPGTYDVTWTRGPEYLPQSRTISVAPGTVEQTERFALKRWIHVAKEGWYSLDHHVHAGGCSHYESPEAGVKPEAMMRQAQGENLDVACVLTWGPCWYHQKSFFEGKVNALSTPKNLMRYDVEVSGFPSSHAGHICLLRLQEDDYPGTTKIEEWPSWTLPVLQWAKAQGGVTGYAHSGWGLEPSTPTEVLPNLVMPKFDGIGANEYIVTVTKDAVDFISAGDTPLTWELNIWYHTLNCGFRTAISGESDYPCIFDERVGMIRTYAPLAGPLEFDGMVAQVKRGASYVSDGRSHILDFTAGDAKLGGQTQETRLPKAGEVQFAARVAAYLPETQDESGKIIDESGVVGRPYWHIEKARVAGSRKVPVELVVNGVPVATKEIEADGTWQDVRFTHAIERSSWVALRVLFSSHTNPLWVTVNEAPVRASRESAEWCRAAVDQCWEMKKDAITRKDRAAAAAAYDDARRTYERIAAECPVPASAAPAGADTLPAGAVLLAADGPSALRSTGWTALARQEDSHATFESGTGAGEQRFRWTFESIKRGRHEVYVWIPAHDGTTNHRKVEYRFSGEHRKSATTMEQGSVAGTWQSLGKHWLRPSGHLELVSTGDSAAFAGPIALVKR